MHVNTYGGANNAVPLGGIKQSGNGADKSFARIGEVFSSKNCMDQVVMEQKTILIIGTYDTKEDELSFLADALHEQGARTPSYGCFCPR